MNTQTQLSNANSQSFMRHARSISENKIFFNKPFIKKLDVMEACFDITRERLGKDYLFLQDAVSVRLYIRDVFGTEALELFEDTNGEMILDLEHAILFYYYMKSQNSPLMNTVEGLVYFMAGHQLDDEFRQISEVAPRGRITPTFELNPKQFRWRRCNHILRKYMLQLSVPEGYTAYAFEQPALAQIAYLMHCGVPFLQAKEQMQQAQGGLFYSFLPPHIENMLMPSILSGGFDMTLMDGYYTQNLIRDNELISSEYTLDEVYNVYNQFVKPYMVDMMGLSVGGIMQEFEENEYLTPSELSVYHLSPQRLGIILKEGVKIEHALPKYSQYFQPVKPFDLITILDGEFL